VTGKRRWFTDDEYMEGLGLAQLLPGAPTKSFVLFSATGWPQGISPQRTSPRGGRPFTVRLMVLSCLIVITSNTGEPRRRARQDTRGGEKIVRGGRSTAFQYQVPSAILVLGVLSTVIVFWIYRIGERQRVNFQHVDAVTDLQVHVATFHLRLEEALTDGDGDAAAKTLPLLDNAVRLSRALLDGGETEHGTPLPPLGDPRFRRQAETIAALLAEMKELTSQRIAVPKAAFGSTVERRFEAVFRDIQETARALEILAERNQENDYGRTGRLLLTMILLWTSAVAASAWALLRLESRRRRAVLALERANEEMEQKVVTRTGELAEANRRLQEEITERRRTEDSLRKSEEGFRGLSLQLRTLLDTIPDRITLVSPDLEVLWANRGAGNLSRPEGGDPAGERCYTLWHDRSSPCGECPAATAFVTGKAETARISTPDGRQWDMRAIPILREDGTAGSVLEVTTDVTEKLNLEAEAMQAAHLASIGELAAGVAHEINNPVSGIINYAQILWNQNAAAGMESDIPGRILEAGGRVSQIVRGLLSFARERGEWKRPVSLADIVSESLALTGSQMRKEGIRLAVEMSPDLPQVLANPNQIQQVMMNIISNARYAMNLKYRGGHENKVLEIRGEPIAVDGIRHVRMTFQDRGMGIAAHILDKVVEPFFSTKPRGVGTGLGLSISHGIVSDHGGRLSIESIEGEFTKVVIDLPARESGHGENPRHR
jgi:signal transduction histidine kinase